PPRSSTLFPYTTLFRSGVPVILPDGSHKKAADGKDELVEIDDADSGVYLRGFDKAQVNIWMWPIGSGEVYGYRTDKKMPPEVRRSEEHTSELQSRENLV